MKISLKKVGIIVLCIAFFSLTIYCLNFSGLSLVVFDNNNMKTELNISNTNDIGKLPVAEQEVTLTCDCPNGEACTCGKMAQDWSKAVTESVTSKQVVKVTLGRDWIAQIDEDTHNSFSNMGNYGFANGRINIDYGAIIILDLAGYSIDRQLTIEQKSEYGNVIRVAGTLNLIDSSYNEEQVKEYYEQGKILEYECGKITGGSRDHNTWGGGGILIEQTTGVLNMYSGMVTNNYSRIGGAGIFSYVYSKMNIYGGIICSNSSENGGGIYCSSGSELNINGGYIIDNTASKCGSAISVYSTKANLTNCIIEDNVIEQNGGTVIATGNSKLQLYSGVKFKNNLSNGNINDIYLLNNCKIELKENISNYDMLSVDFGNGYNLFSPFTFGYKYYANGDNNPQNHFVLSSDNSKKAVLYGDEVRFDYSINSEYDFAYIENSVRKYYQDNDRLHDYNDTTNYVLAKITPNTSINEFISNIKAFNLGDITLYDNKNNIVYQNGNAVNVELSNNGMELAVGTGWYINCQYGGKTERIYLSVLGDLTGDGKVNSADVNYLRQIINDNTIFENSSLAVKLSMIISNKGNAIEKADAEILWNVVCGRIDMSDFI